MRLGSNLKIYIREINGIFILLDKSEVFLSIYIPKIINHRATQFDVLLN